MNQCECPKCLGSKEIMIPRETRGFKYEKCDLCRGDGVVPKELHQDFTNSQKVFDNDEPNY